MQLTVSDVALRSAVTVYAETPILLVEQSLISRSASQIYVTDAEERILGVVHDYQLLDYRLLGGDGQGRVGALMVPIQHSLTPDVRLDIAARLLRDPVCNFIPVVSGGRLIGELCRMNLLRLASEQGVRLTRPDKTADLCSRATNTASSIVEDRESLRLRIA